MNRELPEHQHPLLEFVQRYASAFTQDPAVVDQHPLTDEPVMRLYYESRVADVKAAADQQPKGE